MPGPGTYEVLDAKRKELQGLPSAFKSKTSKTSYLHNPEFPGPGEYEVDNEFVVHRSHATFNVNKHTHNFMPPTKSKRVRVNLYDPFAAPVSHNLIPGPGAYEQEFDSIKSRAEEKTTLGTNSSMFRDSSVKDRFGRLKENLRAGSLPGPG